MNGHAHAHTRGVPLPPLPFSTRLLMILWPAFLMAGVQEALVFVVVDPSSLHWFGSDPITWPVEAIYSVTFLIFWVMTATAGALTQLLMGLPES
jgi:hypothetical protein